MKFADVLRRHNVPYQTEGKYARPGWIQFHCPFCFGGLDPNKPYMGFNLAGGYVNCWRCGPHNVSKTLVTLTGLSWSEVKTLDLDSSPREVIEREAGRLKLPNGLGPLLKPHRVYLRGRGFKPRAIEDLWKVQGIGLSSKLAWRIFIPIHLRGQIVSWTTRSLVDTGLRYISSSHEDESVPHKTLLYGEDYATNAISIHEGPTDVWRVGPGAVATLGTGWKPAQVLRMSRYSRRIVCFDNEPAAQRRARQLCDLLETFPGETMNVILDAKDAATADEDELMELRSLLI